MSMRSERSFLPAIVTVLLAIGLALNAAAPAFAQKAPIPIPLVSRAGAARAASVITRSGSYVLTRNIVLKSGAQDAVDVNVPNVTIDLQGFSITGPGTGTGIGINAPQSQVVIKNGIITGMGGPAVIVGGQGRVSGITATANSGGATGTIQGGQGSAIAANVVSGNNGLGIGCTSACLARGNIVQNNSGGGIQFNNPTSGYAGNVIQGNGGAAVTQGTQIGQNLCNGSLCP